MKATIDELGRLRVTAETALESYALRAWWRDYDRPDGARLSTLLVETVQQDAAPAPQQGPRLESCTKRLMATGKPYPRTCSECGHGPCRA